MSYSIGQVAAQLGISIDTIRYYDKEGLLPFIKRDSNGRRIFSDNDVHLMRTIICLKNAGVPVTEIADFIQMRLQGDSTLKKRYQLLKLHETNLRAQINDLQDTLCYLKFKEWYFTTAIDAGTEKIHFTPHTNEVVPNLAEQYSKYLNDTGQFEELTRFKTIKDYRNRGGH
ncbi:MerR family transcriptional regulator [Limosilactobacillus allomucosae]|uniref:MerR family transcriptional regulator n=1 Tax=Limosilactobacillus allomucosae TaxID=3142938 RepID=A0AAU7BZU9_9LACO